MPRAFNKASTRKMPSKKSFEILHIRLLDWFEFEKEKRDMPWRGTNDPYAVWVSEIMLQQTQVKTVIPYYKRWMRTFPNVHALAAASEAKVLKSWEGLGYYSRARNLHRAAQMVVEQYAGKLPATLAEISQLPGIGRYTAGAILSIAFGKKLPALDGNVKRVLSRLFCLKENGATAASQKRLWETAGTILPDDKTGDFNQALMELGATVCLPQKPTCPLCPVASVCRARAENLQHKFPPPKTRVAAKKIEVSAAVIWKRGKVYIQQRLRTGMMGGLWEFPGGKLEKTETPEACLQREIKEELGVKISVGEKLLTIKHAYTQFRVTLHVFRCQIKFGRIRATECEQWKWAAPEELELLPFPAANAKIVEFVNLNGRFLPSTAVTPRRHRYPDTP